MQNLAMKAKLAMGDALSVRAEGVEVAPGIFELRRFVENKDYCDPVTERWVWSVGQRFTDNKIFAANDVRFADNPNYSCLFLR